MTPRVETVVVGCGQAGLSAAYHLHLRGREHLLLERGEIGETWRSERWDSFRLNTPNWFLRLPGHEYAGDEREAFLTRDETVAYLASYAAVGSANVVSGTEVLSLRSGSHGFDLETTAGPLRADNVVVATGSFRRPTPATSESSVFELHTRSYRAPEQLTGGAVLVVGSAQSGCQIAAELNRSGRQVYLSLGRCPSLPFEYRGRRIYDWVVDIGMMDETVDTLPSPEARLAGNPTVASDDVPHLLGPRRLAADGVTLIGRVDSVTNGRVAVRPDANQRLAEAHQFETTFRQRVDDYAEAHGLDVPTAEDPPAPLRVSEVEELDLERSGITTVIWANGFRPDYGWIELRIFDPQGWPVQHRGVTDVPGLYFVGVHWLHKRKSALLLGVGEDAEHIASSIDGNR
jgi:putative flavoprotein involved in K+ transport